MLSCIWEIQEHFGSRTDAKILMFLGVTSWWQYAVRSSLEKTVASVSSYMTMLGVYNVHTEWLHLVGKR